MIELTPFYQQAARLHHHLCPRIVLGVRMAVYAGDVLGLTLPQTDKRLLVVAETDGCFTDGLAVAANCWVGRRTLRVEDYGRVAATFVNTQTGKAVRLLPQPNARELARQQVPEAANRWQAQLLGYQRMSPEQLLLVQSVTLTIDVQAWIGRPGQRVICDGCGEEVINGRERTINDRLLCPACVTGAYYRATR